MSRAFRRVVSVSIVVLAALCVVAALPSARHAVLRRAAHALVVDEPMAPADAIVVPVWTGAAGAIEAADLVRAGIAPRVAVLAEPATPGDRELVRRGIREQDETAHELQLLRSLGVPSVETIPGPANGTGEEAQMLPAWCDARRFGAIVVVSAPDHSRRLRRELRRALNGRPTTMTIRSARFATFDPDRWWQTRAGARIAITELQKLLLDVVRHPLS